MRLRVTLAVTEVICLVVLACGGQPPQELPVFVSRIADGRTLQWLDAHGPLRGEVPWILRTDLLGPDTFLVAETAAGDRCAEKVTFHVLAAGETDYMVTLVSDLRGRVSWRVTYGKGRRMKLFTCTPRPAAEPSEECLNGGIPKPLFGELVGGFSAQLAGSTLGEGVRAVRFERNYPCDSAILETIGEAQPLEE